MCRSQKLSGGNNDPFTEARRVKTCGSASCTGTPGSDAAKSDADPSLILAEEDLLELLLLVGTQHRFSFLVHRRFQLGDLRLQFRDLVVVFVLNLVDLLNLIIRQPNFLPVLG